MVSTLVLEEFSDGLGKSFDGYADGKTLRLDNFLRVVVISILRVL